MPSLAIRQADTNDITVIRELQEKIWYPTYLPILDQEQVDYMFDLMYSFDALKDQMENQLHTFLLLVSDTEVTGFASYSVTDNKDVFKLHKIYVLPETQGTGSGKFLLQAVIAECAKKGAKEVRLNVNRYNKARFFYEKMGFVVLYEDDIPVGPYEMNDFIMGCKVENLQHR